VQHEADHGEADERSCLAGMTLVVTGQPTTAADPGQRPLNNPSFREHHKAVPVTAAHNLEFPLPSPGDNGLHLAALVARIRDDALQKRKAPARLPQQSLCAIPILYAGRMNADCEEQAQRVGQDVALAAKHLLARVVAGRVERGPPLRAPFALWLSMIAVVGLASRPAVSRTST